MLQNHYSGRSQKQHITLTPPKQSKVLIGTPSILRHVLNSIHPCVGAITHSNVVLGLNS